MAPLAFPDNPVAGQLYPNPAVPGVIQYVWDSVFGVWNEYTPTSVIVQPEPAPLLPRDGDLWYDCTTGTLKVYQSCVGTPGGWTDVYSPGFPVLPANTFSIPAFSSGTGTFADPYITQAAIVASSSSGFIVNTISITGLVPGQYVPIVDLNGSTNGGRFSATNFIADAGGTLTFQIMFDDRPSSVPGTTYVGFFQVGTATVYIESTVNIINAFVTTPGYITGTPIVGNTLSYTPGVASNGNPPYTYNWIWQLDGVDIPGETASTYTPDFTALGKVVTVFLTVTDAMGNVINATTAPTTPVTANPFPPALWNPAPPGAMNVSNPGTSSGTWNGITETIFALGCAEVSTDNVNWVFSTAVNTGDTLYVRWRQNGLCGTGPSGTVMNGSVRSTIYENVYSYTIP